jgi:CheY-like chemotaxis protein
VPADATQLTQVLLNLCTNSADAMPDGGVLEVTVERVEMDERAASAYPELGAGRYVRIVVSDTGSGMTEAVAERALEPFFTTKEVGQGSGLGLSQVLGIATSYGGAVMLQGAAGVGTTVQVFLPSADGWVATDHEAQPRAERGSERVLLVDDEPAVGDVARAMLESLGYSVTLEMSSSAAWEQFQRTPEAHDVLITDRTMPTLAGGVLAERARVLRPGLPVVLMSGFADPDLLAEERVVFLMKPFTRAQLSGAVRAALGPEAT